MGPVMCDTAPMTNSFRLPDQPELLKLPHRKTSVRAGTRRDTFFDTSTDNVPFCIETIAESKTVVRFGAASVARKQACIQFSVRVPDPDAPCASEARRRLSDKTGFMRYHLLPFTVKSSRSCVRSLSNRERCKRHCHASNRHRRGECGFRDFTS